MPVAIGIDVGKRQHVAAVLTSEGKLVGGTLRFANSQAGLAALRKRLPDPDEMVIIGMEASGHYWRPLHAALVAEGYLVVVVNPLQTDRLRAVGLRKAKTDRIDARTIAQLIWSGMAQPSYIPDETILSLRTLTRFRWDLVDQQGDLKRRALSVLDQTFPEFAGLFSDPFGRSAGDLLNRAATAAEFAAIELGDLTAQLKKSSRGQLREAKAAAIHAAAADSLGMASLGPVARIELQAYLAQLKLLEQQVAEAEAAIEDLLATIPHPLLSVPGMGPTLAASILAEIGDIGRFGSADKLVAYAGIDPSVHASGQFTARKVHISKRGSPHLRRALYLVAHGATQKDPEFAAYHQRKAAQGMTYTAIMVAASKKLLHRIYAILKSGEPYRAKEPTPATEIPAQSA